MNYSPNNTASQFTTKLNEVVELDGNWEVGLLDASFPGKVENVTSNDFYYHILLENDNYNYINVLLPNGIYPRVIDVIGALHSAQRRAACIRPTQSPWVYFRYLTLTKRVAMKIMGTAVNVVGVKFSPAL